MLHLITGGKERLLHQRFNLRPNFRVEIARRSRNAQRVFGLLVSRLAEQLAKLREAQFVSLLKARVVRGILLDCVVGQVDKLVVEAAQGELATRRADVTLLAQVSAHRSVHQRNQHKYTHVKFAARNQHGILDVSLHDETRLGLAVQKVDVYSLFQLA